MTQVVCEPSRGENWLDLINTTTPSAYNKCHVHAPVASSDHNLISCVIDIPQRLRLNCPKCVCTQKHINYGLLQLKLESITWSSRLSATTDVDDMWQAFYSVLTEAINSCSSSSVPRSVHVARSQRHSYVKNGNGENTSEILLKEIKHDTKKRLTVCQHVSNLTTHNQKMLFFVEDRSNSSTTCHLT